jgi:hypothetical protein
MILSPKFNLGLSIIAARPPLDLLAAAPQGPDDPPEESGMTPDPKNPNLVIPAILWRETIRLFVPS